eukprot:860203-Rhodomonas_salina.1
MAVRHRTPSQTKTKKQRKKCFFCGAPPVRERALTWVVRGQERELEEVRAGKEAVEREVEKASRLAEARKRQLSELGAAFDQAKLRWDKDVEILGVKEQRAAQVRALPALRSHSVACLRACLLCWRLAAGLRLALLLLSFASCVLCLVTAFLHRSCSRCVLRQSMRRAAVADQVSPLLVFAEGGGCCVAVWAVGDGAAAQAGGGGEQRGAAGARQPTAGRDHEPREAVRAARARHVRQVPRLSLIHI